ncbi:MAG: GNAT family N-acetyltransferase [Gaiellales bacterium]
MSPATSLPYPDPPLAEDGVRLRPWEQRDADCARQGRACSEHDAREWIERQRQRSAAGEGLSLAIVDDGTDAALGYVGLLFRPRLESGIVRREAAVDLPGLVFNLQPGNVGIGYWVVESARRRGLASTAVMLLSRWALRDAGVERIEALTEPDNLASHRVAERAGFRWEGHLRCYLQIDGRGADAVVYALVRGDIDAHIAPWD